MVPSSQILSGAGACLATGVNQRPQGLPLGAVPFRSVGFGPAPSTPPPILALSLLFERSEITSRIAASALLQVVLLAAERATQRYWSGGELPSGCGVGFDASRDLPTDRRATEYQLAHGASSAKRSVDSSNMVARVKTVGVQCKREFLGPAPGRRPILSAP